jgi:hypothetical protein
MRIDAIADTVTSGRKVRSQAQATNFGDAVAVAAMVDRLVHHAEIIVSKATGSKTNKRR